VRAVVDNNLFVSGLLWEGEPHRFLAAALEGKVQLYFSEPLLAELKTVLQREKFSNRFAAKSHTPDSAINLIRASARIVQAPEIKIPASLRDPDDAHVLSCALAAQADAIVTGDQDLLVLKQFEGIPILNVNEALEKLESVSD